MTKTSTAVLNNGDGRSGNSVNFVSVSQFCKVPVMCPNMTKILLNKQNQLPLFKHFVGKKHGFKVMLIIPVLH